MAALNVVATAEGEHGMWERRHWNTFVGHFGAMSVLSRLNIVQWFRVEFVLLTFLLGMAGRGLAANHGAVVSGVVRDAKGVPQMGALVQIFSPDAAVRVTTFTDLQGRYLVAKLLPGLYGVRASASLFLPVSREHLRLQAGRRAIVDLTLSGLFDEPAWLPAKSRGVDEPKDDWNWTLRSSANRPILKLSEDDIFLGSANRDRSPARDRTSAKVEITSPSKSFGRGATRVSVRAETVHANRSRVVVSSFAGRAKTSSSEEIPTGVSTTFERRLGLTGMVASKIAYEAHPEIVGGARDGSGLRVVTISSAERFALGDLAEIEAGTRVQAISGSAPALVTRPFLSVTANPRSWWTVRYSFATSRDNQNYDAAIYRDAELPVAINGQSLSESENGVHQEVALSHRSNATLLELAFYADALDRISVSGGGDRLGAGSSAQGPILGFPEMLVDHSNGSFQALSGGYHNSGMNLLIARALGSGAWVTLQYCSGMAVAPTEAHRTALVGGLPPLEARKSQAATLSVKASVARTGTKVRTTYRWQPDLLVTSIDPYDVLSGGDFLSFHLRQPLSIQGILPEGMELTVDGSNLLDQGRKSFVGRSGSPMYLASTPASLRAGIVFSF